MSRVLNKKFIVVMLSIRNFRFEEFVSMIGGREGKVKKFHLKILMRGRT
jgi:hypothetical protein